MNSRPNILIIHWHDLGTYLGCYGAAVDTPHLDAVAAEGVRFQNAFCASPLCSPARGALWTGRYPHSNGIMGLTHAHHPWRYNRDERTLPMLLRTHGYQSALLGLQHESKDATNLGYDIARDKPVGCHAVADMATEYFAAIDKTKPFLASVGMFEAHRVGPLYPPEKYPPRAAATPPQLEYLDASVGLESDIAGLRSSVEIADAALGRVLAALRANGLDDNTCVLFTTDHGLAFPRAKSTLYDAGIHVALLMRWPEGFAGNRVVDNLVSHVDIVPTLLQRIGAPLPQSLQGNSFWPQLAGKEYTSRTAIFAEKNLHDSYDPIRCVRTARWKYIRNFEPRPMYEVPADVAGSPTWRDMKEHELHQAKYQPRPAEELYDLQSDPHETCNRIDCPDLKSIVVSLRAELAHWMRNTSDPLLSGPIEQPV